MHTNPEDRSSMNARMHEFATRPALLRRALEFHQVWIEKTLGVALADIVIFQVDLNLAQIGVEKILGCSSRPGATSRAVRRLRPLIASADTPADDTDRSHSGRQSDGDRLRVQGQTITGCLLIFSFNGVAYDR
jgi:hypothetical protein